MDVSVIIVSYNTFELTREAIATSFSATPDLDVEVIVIDNNSPDQSAARLRKAFPASSYALTIIENEDNRGFAAANNQGVVVSKGQWLFFLNPDTVVHNNAINVLVAFLKAHQEAGAVGPRVFNTDGSDQVSVAFFTNAWRILRHHLPVLSFIKGQDKREDLIPENTRPVDVVKGCAIMMHKDIFNQIGGWDENYFMYSEETELCLALQKAGYTNYFVREATITHHGGQSSMDYYAKQQVVQQRSALRFLQRHHGVPTRLVHRSSGVIGFGVRALVFPMLAAVRRNNASSYKLRGEAASKLFRWFLFDYS